MTEYIVRWNCGYGDSVDIVNAKNEEDAEEEAYKLWREEAESNADYEVIGEATDELKEEHDLQ